VRDPDSTVNDHRHVDGAAGPLTSPALLSRLTPARRERREDCFKFVFVNPLSPGGWV